ncbi:S-Ena type endospore appendage [Priestia flexa]|uniref:S-Ena type endospore appendage n=1 Tax=Priestia TaxID=2800373 RepID=UPI00064C96FC|nr:MULTISPECIES: S-Ena type endospore appendage [Priestia]KLV29025.1 hypothetical protein ABW04_26615 [Priestia megaterium]MCP1191529.1 hypothetical protein [Priestia flexa]MED3817258.1 hypothetical protein [Priestia aryabhattai]
MDKYYISNREELAISADKICDWVQKPIELKMRESILEKAPVHDVFCQEFSIAEFKPSLYSLWKTINMESISCTLSLTITECSTNKLLLSVNKGEKDEKQFPIYKGTFNFTFSNISSISIINDTETAYKGRFSIQIHYEIPTTEIDFSCQPICYLDESQVKCKEISDKKKFKNKVILIHEKWVTLRKINILIEGVFLVEFKKKNGGVFLCEIPFKDIISVYMCVTEKSKIECKLTISDSTCYLAKENIKNCYTLLINNFLCLNIMAIESVVLCIEGFEDINPRDEEIKSIE